VPCECRSWGKGFSKVTPIVQQAGGKLVIDDIDIGLGESYGPRSAEAEAEAKENRLHEGREQRGGNPRIGRQLWQLLGAAGYVHMDLEVVPVHTDSVGTEALVPAEWDPGEYKPALDLGIMTEADLETMYKAYLEARDSPDRYALFVSLMVCGQKAARDARP
jgi:hypothetical protein